MPSRPVTTISATRLSAGISAVGLETADVKSKRFDFGLAVYKKSYPRSEDRKMRTLASDRKHHCNDNAQLCSCGSPERISQFRKVEDHFQLVLEHAHEQNVPVDLHFCRNDRDHALQLSTGPCPVTGMDIKRFMSGSKGNDFFLMAPHWFSSSRPIVLSQSSCISQFPKSQRKPRTAWSGVRLTD